MKVYHHSRLVLLSLCITAVTISPGAAQKSSAPGVTDSEIKIGQTMVYSGPASAWGAVGRAELAYVKMINDRGGIRGRKITLISLDDGFSPPKTVEQTRKLVEDEGVAFIYGSIGREIWQFGTISTSIACRSCLPLSRWRHITTRSIILGRWFPAN